MGIGIDRIRWLAQPENFLTYAKLCLKIRTKEGSIFPLELNEAQQIIHKEIENQKIKIGKVRVLILKGRQQGCSTYVGARFYHKTTNNIGHRCFIITHKDDATQNLFDMVSRYHKHIPEEVRAIASTDNAKELSFKSLESGYKVATAGSGQSGRSQTFQLFHGSECAFWKNEQEIFAGAIQAVPDLPGTEIILESTANGMNNKFYTMCMEAMRGESEYKLIFVPWYVQREYVKKLPKEFTLSPEEAECKEQYNLTDEQIYWRRIKTKELGSEWLFKQEYPSNPIEAFQTADEEIFINPQAIIRARKTTLDSYSIISPLLIGVDPAWKGKDRTAVCYRKGRKVEKIDVIHNKNSEFPLMHTAGRIVDIINQDNPHRVFIDVIGIGAGLVDRLTELGYGDKIIAVNCGIKNNNDKYYNLKAEMWGNLKEWLEDEIPVDIPDDDELHADLLSARYDYYSNSQIKILGKEEMRKKGFRSPDLAEALALTFSYPVSDLLLQHNKVSVKTTSKPRYL